MKKHVLLLEARTLLCASDLVPSRIKTEQIYFHNMYFLHVHLKTDHVKLNKPLQHWTNILGFSPDLNIGDPDVSFAGDGLDDTDEVDVEDDSDGADDGDDAGPRVGDEVPSSLFPRYMPEFKGDLSTDTIADSSVIKTDLFVCLV